MRTSKSISFRPRPQVSGYFWELSFFNVAYSNRFSTFTRKRRAPSGQIFAVAKSKNCAYCRVRHFKVFHSKRFFFHFLGLNWSLNDVKHTNLVFQTQLVSTKYFLIYTHFAVDGKGLKTLYFHPSLCNIPTSSKQHTFSDQLREYPKNIET